MGWTRAAYASAFLFVDACSSAPPDDGCPALDGGVAIACRVMGPTEVVVDDEAAYVAALDGLLRVSLQDHGVTRLAVPLSNITALALDETHVYWTELLPGSAHRVSKVGGDPTELPPFEGSARGVAVDDTHVYLAVATEQGQEIVASTKMGTAWELLASVPDARSPTALAADETALYWTFAEWDLRSGGVMMVGKSGGEPVVLAAIESPRSGAIALDDTFVYFLSWDLFDGSVFRVAKMGGSPERLAYPQASPTRIAVAPSGVYWTASRTVMWLPAPGAEPVVLASGLEAPWGIAVGADEVLCTVRRSVEESWAGGALLSVPRPP